MGLLTFFAIALAVLCYVLFHYSVWLSLAVALVYFIITFYLLVYISIYMKGGYSGFVPLVPFYSQYAYYDIAVGNGWKFLFLLIPVFGIFYFLYVNYKLGKVFVKMDGLHCFSLLSYYQLLLLVIGLFIKVMEKDINAM